MQILYNYISEGMKYFINTFDNLTTPHIVTTNDNNGKVLRTLVDNKKLNEYFSLNTNCKIIDTNNLADAVQAAYSVAQKGDTVLLSPCCASFDLFKNYEDRGEQFKQAVKQL